MFFFSLRWFSVQIIYSSLFQGVFFVIFLIFCIKFSIICSKRSKNCSFWRKLFQYNIEILFFLLHILYNKRSISILICINIKIYLKPSKTSWFSTSCKNFSNGSSNCIQEKLSSRYSKT